MQDSNPAPSIRIQLDKSEFDQVEDWRRAQDKIPSRVDAARRLIALGLKREPRAA
jgi:hypothetical protein